MLSDRDLKRLLAVEQYGSFSKAAEALFVSRSALLQQVKGIEKEVGFSIFLRDFKGVCITEAGRHFLNEMQRFASRYEQIVIHCQEIAEKRNKQILIGSLPNLSSVMVPEICKVFCKRYPDVEVQFKEFFAANYFQNFQAGHFDISVEYMSDYHRENKDILILTLKQDRYCCGVLPSHPLAGKSMISFKDLRGQKLMMYRKGITKCDDVLRDYILQNEPEIQLIDLENYDSSLAVKCELEGAVLLFYSMYADNFHNFIPIPTDWEQKINIGLGYHVNSRPIVKKFIKVASELYIERTRYNIKPVLHRQSL